MKKIITVDGNEACAYTSYMFTEVGKIEKEHEERYRALLENVKSEKVFKSETPQMWICRNCGHIHYGEKAPELCPVCEHPQSFFERRATNY